MVFLRSHPDLLQTIEEAEQQYRLTPPESTSDKAKDQVIAALRRRLDEQKQALACTGYLVYPFQKSGREQSYKNHIIMCLVSGEQRTGTVGLSLSSFLERMPQVASTGQLSQLKCS